jgi:spectinomycin phosphotransferase
VRDEPAELSRATVRELLRRHWDLEPVELRYAPVGFGSYHWIAAGPDGPRWFVTANHLSPGGNWLGSDPEAVYAALVAAARTTRALADQGFEFVLAPVPDRTGVLVRVVRAGWTMHVLPYLDGWSTDDGAWLDRAERTQIAGIVGRLHAAVPPAGIRRWDVAVPGRVELVSTLDDLDWPWSGGPYADPTRRLLIESRASIGTRFRRFDELAREVTAWSEPWVVTHGEPHSANVIRTPDGRMCLIDWDTVALAPRERDLAAILDGSIEVLAAYQRNAGPVVPRAGGLEMFRLWWVLAEICGYVRLFRHAHIDSADTAESWRNLACYAHE